MVVEKVQHELLEGTIKVYNLEVEDSHTYFVGEYGVLVHNSCGGGSDTNSEYYDADGNPIWPPHRGFDGETAPTILEPGTLVDRYGYDDGTFVSPKGTPYTERSLPTGTDQKPYTVFEIIKPVEAQSGKIAPWFGEKGGGKGYEFSERIVELLDKEILRKVLG